MGLSIVQYSFKVILLSFGFVLIVTIRVEMNGIEFKVYLFYNYFIRLEGNYVLLVIVLVSRIQCVQEGFIGKLRVKQSLGSFEGLCGRLLGLAEIWVIFLYKALVFLSFGVFFVKTGDNYICVQNKEILYITWWYLDC